MSDSHLDDEQLSLLLDGADEEGRAHLVGGCQTCSRRFSALTRARDGVAAASVAPLAPDAVDRFVATALGASAPSGEVVPLSVGGRSRLRTPPPAWLLGVAAALAAVVGVAGLLRAGNGRPSENADVAAEAPDEDSSAAGKSVTADATSSEATALGDPELVSSDLADQDDPAELAGILADQALSTPAGSNFSARRSSAEGEAGGDGAPPAAPTAAPQPAAGGAAASEALTADRAQCRAEAERYGGGRLSILVSTATVRWRGQPGEILVFRLAEPDADGGVSFQALVLARPGCALLADPRF